MVAGFSAWFYLSPISNFKLKVATVIPYPAATVNGRPILIKDVLWRQQITQSSQDTALNLIVSEKQMDVVADKFGIGVSAKDLDSELSIIKQQDDFNSLISKYGLSENDFKNKVLKPELLSSQLKLWFNGQRSLNPAQYALADAIKLQLNKDSSSSTFASLVAQYSQDNSTKPLDGNLGFVENNQLWPEFQAAVESAAAGSLVTVPGRDGLYIFRIQAKDNNGQNNSPRTELQEIYLKTADFNSWYNNEIKNIKIKKLI